jgi:hypothetical protein
VLAKESGLSPLKKPKIREKYCCSEGRGEVTVTLAVDDAVLGKTELVLEHKKDSID